MFRILLLAMAIFLIVPTATVAVEGGDAHWLGPAHWEIRECLRLAGMGQTEQAVTVIERVLVKDDQNPAARAARILVDALAGRVDEAVKALAELAGQQSGDPFVRVCWLRVRAMQGADPALLSEVDRLKAAYAAFPDAHRLAAEIRQRAGMTDGALADCRQWLKLEPAAPEAHRLHARILQGAGRTDEALTAVDAGLEAHPTDAALWNLRGLLCRDRQQAAAAQRAFEKAVELAPGDPEALCNLGEILLAAAAEKEALQRFHQAIAADPGFERAYGNCAFIALNNGQPDRLRAFGDALLKARPDSALARNLIGRSLLETGRVAEALPWFQEVLARHPDNFDALFNLGKTAGTLEQFELAADSFARADALRPGYQEVVIMLGFSLLQGGQTERALPQLRRGVALDPLSDLAQKAAQILESLGE